jgi:hypothetical protein
MIDNQLAQSDGLCTAPTLAKLVRSLKTKPGQLFYWQKFSPKKFTYLKLKNEVDFKGFNRQKLRKKRVYKFFSV